MHNNKISVINILIFSCLLAVSGCTLKQEKSLTVKQISKVDFNLPQQIKWQQARNEMHGGNVLIEWLPEGYTVNSTPVRIIYSRSSPAKTASEFIALKTKMLRDICLDVSVSQFKTNSNYIDQYSAKIICSRLGNKNYGTVSYASAFSDEVANHLIVSEIKFPASEEAGLIIYKSAKEKLLVQNRNAIADLMYNFNKSLRVCNSRNYCR